MNLSRTAAPASACRHQSASAISMTGCARDRRPRREIIYRSFAKMTWAHCFQTTCGAAGRLCDPLRHSVLLRLLPLPAPAKQTQCAEAGGEERESGRQGNDGFDFG